MSKFGRSESAWRDTSVVPPATNRCSIWSTILTCWSASRGRWPESFDRLWQSLRERHGPQAGTRAMIELLGLGKRYGWDRLREAIKESLALGCTDAAAVRQGAAHAGHRVELRAALGAGDQGTAQPHWVSGSTADDGGGRARSSRHSEAHPRCQATPAEDTRRVRLQSGASDSSGEDSRAGRRRLH